VSPLGAEVRPGGAAFTGPRILRQSSGSPARAGGHPGSGAGGATQLADDPRDRVAYAASRHVSARLKRVVEVISRPIAAW